MARDEPTSRWVWLSLAILLLWSLALRAWFASSELDAGRYFDERYNVKNVRSILETGHLRPVSFYYPSLSYLPHTAILALAREAIHLGSDFEYSWFEGPRLRPEGYLVGRLVQVGFGVLSIFLTFLLGRRLFSPHAGLLAALLVAVAPIHLRLSTIWKPDILLLLTVLLALGWSLDAVARPRLPSYLLAGVGVGLALSSKLNGGPCAIPLTLAALALGWKVRRHWAYLGGAGIVAVGVFLALNPQLDLYLKGLERNLDLYEMRAAGSAARGGGGFLGVLGLEMDFLLSRASHGPIVGTLGVLGLVAVGAGSMRRRVGWLEALPKLMFLSFPLGYSLLYAATTPYAKPNNFLLVLPFSAIGAGYLLVSTWTWAKRRWKPLARRGVGAALGVVLAAPVVYPVQVYAYDVRIPTTWHRALAWATGRLEPPAGRVVYFETNLRSRALNLSDVERLIVRPRPDLEGLGHETLSRADAEVFFRSHLDGPARDFYAHRLAAVEGDQVAIFEPGLFRSRGEEVAVVLHPLSLLGTQQIEARRVTDRRLEIPLPNVPRLDGLVSFEVWLPHRRGSPSRPRFLHRDRPLELFGKARGSHRLWLTERVPWRHDEDRSVLLELPPGPDALATVTVRTYHWRPPSGPTGP